MVRNGQFAVGDGDAAGCGGAHGKKADNKPCPGGLFQAYTLAGVPGKRKGPPCEGPCDDRECRRHPPRRTEKTRKNYFFLALVAFLALFLAAAFFLAIGVSFFWIVVGFEGSA